MPHLVLLYTADLDQRVDVPKLCNALAGVMQLQRDESGKAVFPIGGIRVLGYPAAHSAVADGKGDSGFLYANLRMGAGRSASVHKAVGDALLAVLEHHLSDELVRRPLGITLQIDESPGQIYDGKHSSLHPLFNK